MALTGTQKALTVARVGAMRVGAFRIGYAPRDSVGTRPVWTVVDPEDATWEIPPIAEPSSSTPVIITDCSNFTRAVEDAGDDETIIRVTQRQRICENVTVPENVTVEVTPGDGWFDIDVGAVLTIAGVLVAAPRLIFGGSGASLVQLTNLSYVRYPQWWGAKANAVYAEENCSFTSGSNYVDCSSAIFTSAMRGMSITVEGGVINNLLAAPNTETLHLTSHVVQVVTPNRVQIADALGATGSSKSILVGNDDTLAIQYAVNQGGGVVFPGGRYFLQKHATVDGGLNACVEITADSTYLQGLPGSILHRLQNVPDGELDNDAESIFYAERRNDLIFRDLSFRGYQVYRVSLEQNTGVCMLLKGSSKVRIDNCYAHDGFRFVAMEKLDKGPGEWYDDGYYPCEDISVTDCSADNCEHGLIVNFARRVRILGFQQRSRESTSYARGTGHGFIDRNMNVRNSQSVSIIGCNLNGSRAASSAINLSSNRGNCEDITVIGNVINGTYDTGAYTIEPVVDPLLSFPQESAGDDETVSPEDDLEDFSAGIQIHVSDASFDAFGRCQNLTIAGNSFYRCTDGVRFGVTRQVVSHEETLPVISNIRILGNTMRECKQGVRINVDDLPTRWAALTVYAADALVIPSTSYGTGGPWGNGFYYHVTSTGGTSAAAEPVTWPTTLGATVVDGTCTWTCVGVWPWIQDISIDGNDILANMGVASSNKRALVLDYVSHISVRGNRLHGRKAAIDMDSVDDFEICDNKMDDGEDVGVGPYSEAADPAATKLAIFRDIRNGIISRNRYNHLTQPQYNGEAQGILFHNNPGMNGPPVQTVASAATVTLPDVDGDAYYVISGSTQIDLLQTPRTGRIVTLRFGAAVTVTHNASGAAGTMRLDSGVDFVAANLSTLTLRAENASVWYEIGRKA